VTAVRIRVPEENVRVPLAEFEAVWTRAAGVAMTLGWVRGALTGGPLAPR
jgi:hypothetical protein